MVGHTRRERMMSIRTGEFRCWVSDFIKLIQHPHGASPKVLVLLDVLNPDLATARNLGCGVNLFREEQVDPLTGEMQDAFADAAAQVAAYVLLRMRIQPNPPGWVPPAVELMLEVRYCRVRS